MNKLTHRTLSQMLSVANINTAAMATRLPNLSLASKARALLARIPYTVRLRRAAVRVNNEVTEEINTLQLPDSAAILSRIREFPPEIRIMIWEKCLTHSTLPSGYVNMTPLVPTLLAGLRPDLPLYNEALHVHFKIRYFVLTSQNYIAFKRLKDSSLSRVRRLSICLEPLYVGNTLCLPTIR